jgi:hypothetical protein
MKRVASAAAARVAHQTYIVRTALLWVNPRLMKR